mmetsp:Transcript_35221/g.100610  ORF Transcript_35221/g.100610 Transcript_35221/m.100610 type:complete len:383 (+) Transcript_35221:121-1269(+)
MDHRCEPTAVCRAGEMPSAAVVCTEAAAQGAFPLAGGPLASAQGHALHRLRRLGHLVELGDDGDLLHQSPVVRGEHPLRGAATPSAARVVGPAHVRVVVAVALPVALALPAPRAPGSRPCILLPFAPLKLVVLPPALGLFPPHLAALCALCRPIHGAAPALHALAAALGFGTTAPALGALRTVAVALAVSIGAAACLAALERCGALAPALLATLAHDDRPAPALHATAGTLPLHNAALPIHGQDGKRAGRRPSLPLGFALALAFGLGLGLALALALAAPRAAPDTLGLDVAFALAFGGGCAPPEGEALAATRGGGAAPGSLGLPAPSAAPRGDNRSVLVFLADPRGTATAGGLAAAPGLRGALGLALALAGCSTGASFSRSR